jgi:uncharacterized protein YjbI with pentapeptide repeats
MKKFYDNTGKILCQECGKGFDVILPTHLKKFHQMTMKEYKEKYEDFPLASKSFGSKQKYKNTVKAMKNDEIINQQEQEIEIEEFQMDKIPKIQENNIKQTTSFFNDLKEFTTNSLEDEEIKLNFNDSRIHKTKLEVLNFLCQYFQDLKNSHFIEKINLSGILEYRLVTDMCSEINKIDFEFPDVFWHNCDLPKSIRDQLLQKDGWTIINFSGTNLSHEKIKEILREKNLI